MWYGGKFWKVFMMSMLVFSFISCAQKQTAGPEAAARQLPQAEKAPVKPGWEAEWEQTQKDARKEGKVVLYAIVVSDIRDAIATAMKKYGIELESMGGRGNEIAEKVIRERRAGIYTADMYISGITSLLTQIKPAGAMASIEPLLILPDVKDQKTWYKGEIPFSDKDKTIIAFAAYPNGDFHVNTNIVKPGDINSMRDLLLPKWEGKIIMDDPTVAGRGNNVIAGYTIRLGEDYIKQLAKQKPVLTRDRRQSIDWVVKGRYPIGIGVYPDVFAEYLRAGAPISSILFNEVAFIDAGAGFITYFDKAPHPNASKVLLNWLLSKEGQTIWTKLANAQSARVDVPAEYLKEQGVHLREPGVEYLEAAKEAWVLELKPKAEKSFLETFMALTR